MPELTIGQVFHGHRVECVIGRGGMGVVYEALHIELEQRRALKVLAPELAEDEDFRRRFRHEWQITASIDHPHVIPIYDAGEYEGVMYIAMRYVAGTDLATEIAREHHLQPARALRLVRDVAEALDAAHARGLVHRDVKPANILIEFDDRVYLTDFGLTKEIGASSGPTRTGSFLGTVDFAAPEQIRGERVDARTDVYALAAVLCQALTGEPPFEGESDVSKMFAILSQPRPVLSERMPGLPPELDAVIARAMAITPSYRYPSAGDFARAAAAAVESRPVVVPEREVASGPAAASTAAPVLPPPPAPAPAGAAAQGTAGVAPPRRSRVRGRARGRGRATKRTLIPVAGLLAVAGVGALISVIAAGGGATRGSTRGDTSPAPPSLTLHPAGAPLSFAYPASFRTTGLNVTILTGANGFAGLGPDDFLAASQIDVATDTRGLRSNGIPFTQAEETHAGLATQVVNYDATDTTTNARYHERDYYFLIRGLSWDLTCAWTAAHAAQIEPACLRAIDSVVVS